MLGIHVRVAVRQLHLSCIKLKVLNSILNDNYNGDFVT